MNSRPYYDSHTGWQIAGAIFTIITGTLLHFIYEWTGENYIASLVGAVNESTWEHLKLIFFPMLIFSIIEYFGYGRNQDNFSAVRYTSIFIGMLTIVVLFYTYSGIVGTNYGWANILVFIISVVTAYYWSWRKLDSGWGSKGYTGLVSFVMVMVFTVFFIIFTYNPPAIGLFMAPAE